MSRRGRPPHPDILTPREREVLGLIAQGLSNEEIGRRLGVSRNTIKYHVGEILSRLGVESREQAVLQQQAGARPWASVVAALAAASRRIGALSLRAKAALAGGVIVAGAVGLGIAISSGAIAGGTKEAAAPPDSLQLVVERIDQGPARSPLRSWTLADQSQVHDLYDRITQLPFVPREPMDCPVPLGVYYQLYLRSPIGTVLAAEVEPTGCRYVSLSDGRRLWAVGADGQAFLDALRSALGLSQCEFIGNPLC